jgi:hypothetical protein
LCLAAAFGAAPLGCLVFDTRIAQPGRLPDGWRIRVTHGSPNVSVVTDSEGSVLHLKSQASSFALERPLDVDPAEYPYLTWKWKVTTLPRGGDFRRLSTDDQAAQVLIAFGDRRVLEYIWDSSAPKDLFQSATSIPLLHIYALVCRSGASDLGQWLSEARNVAADYERAYGRRPAHHVRGIRIQINSQHTGSSAESYFGDVAFRAKP